MGKTFVDVCWVAMPVKWTLRNLEAGGCYEKCSFKYKLSSMCICMMWHSSLGKSIRFFLMCAPLLQGSTFMCIVHAYIHDSGMNCFEINPYFSTTSGVKPLRSRNLNFGKSFRPSNTFPCYFQFLNSVLRQNCCLHFHLYDDEALCLKRIVWTTSFPACWLELRW